MVTGFVDFLIRNNALEEEYREDAVYGMTLAVEKVIVCMAVCVVSFLLGKFLEAAVFTLCFLGLRQTTGGFHAKSFPGCFAGSVVTVVLCLEVFVPLLAEHMIIFGMLFIFSIIFILLFALVNHPDLMLTAEEQGKYRIWGRGILFMETGAAVAGTILKMKWQQYIMLAVIICAVFIVLAKLIRQEVRTDENKENRQPGS